MLFVDEVKIHIKAGDGGRGCESFYRDLWMRYPRPDGGDGGNGGDVMMTADSHMRTLLDLRYQQNYKAERGGHASSKGKTGKTGKHCLIRVPLGTLVKDHATGLLIRDLIHHGDSVTVAKGGKGGLGNERRKKTVPPKEGETREIDLELKLVADVGLIGFPNAGKSTLISAISKVRSRIGNYPFTTLQPILGFVHHGDFEFIAADLPGIIEGAHLGKGLGDRFLRHAQRTKMLVHVIDIAGTEERDPLDDYKILNKELKAYDDDLAARPKIIVANKMDLPQAEANLKRFKKKYKEKVISVSAMEKQGLDKMVAEVVKVLRKTN